MSHNTSRLPRTPRLRRVVTAALLAAGTGVLSGVVAQASDRDGSTASGPKRPAAFTSLHGSGGGVLNFTGFEGDHVRFTIRGHTTELGSPVSVKGDFEVTHVRPDGAPFAEVRGHLDCMWVAGDVAVATGIVDESDTPGLPGVELDGRRIGFTVDDDGRHDRIGWSWAVTGFGRDVPACTSTAPFFEVERGWFSVWDQNSRAVGSSTPRSAS